MTFSIRFKLLYIPSNSRSEDWDTAIFYSSCEMVTKLINGRKIDHYILYMQKFRLKEMSHYFMI